MTDIRTALNASNEAIQQLLLAGERTRTAWTSPRAPGKWSPSQIVEHVACTLEESANMAAGRPSKFGKLPAVVHPIGRLLFYWVLRKAVFPKAKANKAFNPASGPATPPKGAFASRRRTRSSRGLPPDRLARRADANDHHGSGARGRLRALHGAPHAPSRQADSGRLAAGSDDARLLGLLVLGGDNQTAGAYRNEAMMTALDMMTGSQMSRRRMLGGTLAAALGATASRIPLFAQQLQTHRAPGVTPKPKGPLVFLDYDQEELDDAYTQPLWAPNQTQLDKRNAQKSAQAIARLGPPRRLAYGPTQAEKLDLFLTKKPNAPINVFIHGGAWQFGTAGTAAYQWEMFVDAGAHFVALDFNNVIETKGDLMVMADQVRRGVAWVYRNAKSFGGDPNQSTIRPLIRGALGGCRPHHRVAETVCFADGHRERCPLRERHVQTSPSEPVGEEQLCQLHATGARSTEPPAPSRCSHRASRRRAWHARNAGVPEAEQGVCRGGESGRQDGRLDCAEWIQPLRGGGEPWQSVWSARSIGLAADETIVSLAIRLAGLGGVGGV